MSEILLEQREIRKREYMICCPNCGKFQYRFWGEGAITFQCERCKKGMVVLFMNGQITMRDPDPESQTGLPKMKATARA